MKRFFVLILIIMGGVCLAAELEEKSLYSASVPVLSQSIDERTEAAKEGLKQVVIKLTGTSSVIDNNPDMAQEIQRAAYYLQAFHYELASLSASRHTLHLHFNAAEINTLLARERIPIWHGKRPVILLWLTYQGSHDEDIISEDSVDELLPQLRTLADERGLPLVLPLMDTQELSYLSEFPAKEVPLASYQTLAKRYDYDAILVGYLNKSGKEWEGKWILLNNNTVLEWEQNNQDVDVLIASMLNDVSQYFFKKSKTQQLVNGVKT